MFSSEQHAQLEAMGFVLYRPCAATPAHVPVSDQNTAAGFWQSSLGINVARLAPGIDTACIAIEADVRGREAKKRLWQQLKALRKAR
jgi:hypothetical protein